MALRLKYLFRAYYRDGGSLLQTQENKSTTREGGTAFTDVDHSRLAYFQLCEDAPYGHKFGVSLVDGVFDVDGIPFEQYEGEDPLTDFKLIYFARAVIPFNGQTGEADIFITSFRIGWTAKNLKGEEVRKVLKVR